MVTAVEYAKYAFEKLDDEVYESAATAVRIGIVGLAIALAQVEALSRLAENVGTLAANLKPATTQGYGEHGEVSVPVVKVLANTGIAEALNGLSETLAAALKGAKND